MNLLLTINLLTSKLKVHSKKTGGGFGHSFSKGAIAMRRLVHGFFNAYSFMVGVLGSLRACRLLCPVDQPSTSATLSLVTSGGSLKTTAKEKAMLQHSYTQEPTKTLILSVNFISYFIPQDSNRKIIAKDLTFNQVKSISAPINDSVIKFQKMGVSA